MSKKTCKPGYQGKDSMREVAEKSFRRGKKAEGGEVKGMAIGGVGKLRLGQMRKKQRKG